MIRTILIVFGLAAIYLIGLWTQKLRHQIQQLEHKNHALEKKLEVQPPKSDLLANTTPAPTQPSKKAGDALDAQIIREKIKLEGMKQSLKALQGRGGTSSQSEDDVDRHIREDNAALRKLNDELKDLQQDGQIVNERSKSYRIEQENRIRLKKAADREQMERLNAFLKDLNEQLQFSQRDRADSGRAQKIQNLRAQILESKEQRRQLELQNKELDQKLSELKQNVQKEVASEQSEVQSERTQSQSEVQRLRVDIEHWQGLKSNSKAGRQTHERDIQDLILEIANQTQLIQKLEQIR